MIDEIQATKKLDTALEAIRQHDPQAFSPANMQRLMTEHLEPQHDPRSVSGWSLKRDPAVTVGVRLPQWLVQAIDAYVTQLGSDVSRSDVCRQWIRDGLYTALQPQESPTLVKTERNQDPVGVSGLGKSSTNADPDPTPNMTTLPDPDPATVPEAGTVAIAGWVAEAVAESEPGTEKPAPASRSRSRRVSDTESESDTNTRRHEAQIGPQIRDIARGYPGVGIRKHPEYIKLKDFAAVLAEEHGIKNTLGQPIGKGALGRILKYPPSHVSAADPDLTRK